MNYFFCLDTNPKSKTYEKPLALVRVDEDAATERYDIPTSKWMLDMDIARSMSGIGGDGYGWQDANGKWEQFIEKVTPKTVLMGMTLIEEMRKSLEELNKPDEPTDES